MTSDIESTLNFTRHDACYVFLIGCFVLSSFVRMNAQRNSEAFYVEQKENALEMISDGRALMRTKDKNSPIANFGRGGRVSQNRYRKAGQRMVNEGRDRLAEAEAKLKSLRDELAKVDKFIENEAEFKVWENAGGQTVEAALYSSTEDAVTLVRRNGRVFTVKKNELAEKHDDAFTETASSNGYPPTASGEEPRGRAAGPEVSPDPENNAGGSERETIADGIKRLVSDLRSGLKEVDKVAVTRFYVNGSNHKSHSAYFLNQLLSELLRQGGFEVFDRSALPVVMEESRLEFLNKGESDTTLTSGEAIIVGDLLFSETSSEAFLSIRAINTANSQVLAARTRRVRMARDAIERLGIAYRDLSGDALPELKPKSTNDYVKSLKRAADRARSFAITVDAPTSSKTPVRERIAYFKALEIAASTVSELYDRDLLLTLFEESSTSAGDSLNLGIGEAIISLETGGLADHKNRVPVKIHRKDNAALLGICNLTFHEGAHQEIDTPWTDSFAAVRKHIDETTAVDPAYLKKEVKFALNGFTMNRARFSEDSFEGFLWYFEVDHNGVSLEQWDRVFLTKHSKSTIDEKSMRKSFEYASKKIALDSENKSEFRRKMAALVIGGFRQSDLWFEGLYFKAWQWLRDKVTPKPNGEAVHQLWLDALRAFAKQWNPNTKDVSHEGTFSHEEIEFDYSIDYRFEGIYPDWVSLKLDLSPMKDNLYRVIKNENSND